MKVDSQTKTVYMHFCRKPAYHLDSELKMNGHIIQQTK